VSAVSFHGLYFRTYTAYDDCDNRGIRHRKILVIS